MKGIRQEAFEAQSRTERPARPPEGERPIARLPRVLSSAEIAECCCPDECLVDHGN